MASAPRVTLHTKVCLHVFATDSICPIDCQFLALRLASAMKFFNVAILLVLIAGELKANEERKRFQI